jgi:hypothetical protein
MAPAIASRPSDVEKLALHLLRRVSQGDKHLSAGASELMWKERRRADLDNVNVRPELTLKGTGLRTLWRDSRLRQIRSDFYQCN